jgi:hypothetical protein
MIEYEVSTEHHEGCVVALLLTLYEKRHGLEGTIKGSPIHYTKVENLCPIH